jgi:uncharacterized membrane protein
MIWILPALIGALTHTALDIGAKSLLKEYDIWWVASLPYLIGGSLLLFITMITGIPRIYEGFFPALTLTVCLNIFGTYLYYQAIYRSDLSTTVPMLAFTPVFLILSGSVILHETPSIMGVIGIISVILGSILVNTPSITNITRKRKFRASGPIIMFFVAILFSITTTFDKLTVLNSNPIFASATTLLILGMIFLILHQIYGSQEPMTKRSSLLFMGVGLSIALSSASICIAYTTAIVAYVIPIKRFSILFSVIAGGFFFNEPAFGMRLIGAMIMAFGAILISIAGIVPA